MRRGVLVGLWLWLTPVLAAGTYGLGLSWWPAVAIGGFLAIPTAVLVHLIVDNLIPQSRAPQPVVLVCAAVLGVAAITQIAPLSVFMMDVSRTACAAARDPFRANHYCFTAYSEAARLAGEPGNIYDEQRYVTQTFGRFRVDSYHYPPSFLLLPATLRAVTASFDRTRALWFSVEALALMFTLAWTARWIGGRAGTAALMAGVAFIALPPTMVALQTGNFQVVAIPLAMAAFLGVVRRVSPVGAVALAFTALGKIFPGILVVWLAVTRRWQALVWTTGAGAALIGITLMLYGPAPFQDFVVYEVPRISSGAAFPQSETPAIAPQNQSFYGLTVRLRMLGVSSLDAATGLRLTSIYGFVVLLLAAFVAWRARFDRDHSGDRLRLAVVALALVTLASFRSPFVGGVYGLVSTCLLLLLLTAQAHGRTRLAWGVFAAMFIGVVWLMPPQQLAAPGAPSPTPVVQKLALSAVMVVAAMATALWATLGVGLRRSAYPDAR